MGELSWWHWLLIIAAFILIFGAKKLPDAARGLGRSLRILKSEVAAMHEDGAPPTASRPDAVDPTAASGATAPAAVTPLGAPPVAWTSATAPVSVLPASVVPVPEPPAVAPVAGSSPVSDAPSGQ